MKTNSFKQNLLLIMFGLLIAVLLGEAFFRIYGLIVIETKNEISRINKNNYRILCLGDSVTYGVGSSDFAKYSYPAQLQRILDNKTKNIKFEVINHGRPGMNSSQLLNRLGNNILEFEPNMIIIMIGMNDAWQLEESNVLKIYNENIFKNLILSFESILNRSKLYKFVKLLFIFNESISYTF